MRIKTYIIPQKPMPWQRARLHGKYFFDGQSQDKVAYGLLLARQHNNEPLFSVPLALNVTFFMQLPKDAKKRRFALENKFHITTPDCDNLIKFLLDASQGIIMENDKIICKIEALKVYDREPRTEFTLSELK